VTLRLGMKKLSTDSKYLANPMFISRKRSENFKHMVQQVDNTLKGWQMKTLSWAGRSTLLKSVVQTIPTYTMSAFDVPNHTCEQLDKLRRRF
jgi:hypothetical protein